MKLQPFPWKLALRLGLLAIAGFMLVMFQRSCEVERQEAAERRRIDCMDKPCPGDQQASPVAVIAPPDHMVLKLNGSHYVAPLKYVKGFAGLSFYWPSKTPVAGREDRQPYPEQGKDYADVAVDVFLTGRARWPDPSVQQPWDERGWPTWIKELRAQGRTVDEEQLSPDLKVYRLRKSDGSPHRNIFVATNRQSLRGGYPPAIDCDASTEPPGALRRCTGGDYWQPDVFADYRFSAAHAQDWPEIHAEIVRVLNLLTKVQP